MRCREKVGQAPDRQKPPSHRVGETQGRRSSKEEGETGRGEGDHGARPHGPSQQAPLPQCLEGGAILGAGDPGAGTRFNR